MARPTNIEKVLIKDKLLLTIYEAAAYTGIGIHHINSLVKDPDCSFVLLSGNRRLIKRKLFEEFINKSDHI